MPRIVSKLSRVVILGITLVILVIPFCLYYFVYVSSQQAYFIDRSHRSLAGIGRQIVKRVDGLVSVVLSPARKACDNDPLEIDPDLLKEYFKPLSPFGTVLEFDRASASTEIDENNPGPTPVVTVKFKQDGSTILNYECSGGPEFKLGRFSVASHDTERLLTPPIARFVFDDRQVADEGLFDRVFVADSETGEVVFEYGRDSMTIVNLDDLLSARTSNSPGGKTNEAGSSDHSTEKTQTPQTANGGGKSRQGSRRPERGSSDLTKITIAETDYKLFVQPIQLNFRKAGSDGEEGYRLTVCGLVRFDSLNRKTFSFSYTLLLLFILLVLMTTLSGPLIKLRLIGPKDRLRKADVVLTGCSAFFGTALLTLTLLDGYTYVTVENRLDEQLERLASSVDRNLRSELASASDQLDALNGSFRDTLPGAGVETSCPSGDPNVPFEPRYYKENILRDDGVLDPRSAPYPYFNNATWANVSGEQRIKFTTRKSHTAFVSVAGRRFFTDALAGKLWNVSVDRGSQRPLCVEALNSRTSGENVAVISKLTPDQKYVVSFLDTRLLSLYDPVLPAGYGFCVIDSTGLVLFHTDDEKNLDEHFFEECNMDKRLRGAVQSRESEWLSLQYLGGSQRGYVTPIADLPWSLVVFRDRQILRTVNLETMTLTAIAFTFYALLLAVVLGCIFLFRPKTRFSMIWPDPKRHECYKQVAAVNFALFIIFGVLVIVSSDVVLIVWALLFPALSLVHFLLLADERRRLQLSKLPVLSMLADWRRSYSVALVSLMALACVAPTMAFFKLMRDEQIRVFIRHGQMSLARGLEAREDQVRGLYSAMDPQVDVGTAREQLIKTRLDSELDVYSSFFFCTHWKQDKEISGRPLGGLLRFFLTTFSPFYNETSVDSLPLARAQSSDKRWAASEDGDKVELVLRAITRRDDNRAAGAPPNATAESAPPQGDVKPPAAGWTLTSVVPGFMSLGKPLLWLFLVAVSGVLVVTYFALRFAARRILLLDLKTPGLTGRFQIPPAGQTDENYLVVSPPVLDRRGRFPMADPPTFLHVDLSSIETEEAWRKQTEFIESMPDLPVVIDGFEFNREDTVWNERKLWFAENLVKKRRRVVILSSVDPINFPLTVGKRNDSKTINGAQKNSEADKSDAGSDEANELSGDRLLDSERWAVALALFVRVNTFDQAEPGACPGLFSALGAGENPWRYLESLARRVPTENADSEELIAAVREQAENYYRAVWSTCSRDERMTLFRVAKDGLVSRRDPDLRRLMQRGFLVRDPSLRLMDESFRRFVLSVSAEEGVNTYRADVESHWDRLKAPLLLVLLGVIAFLFVTQKELFDSTLTLVSALTGGAVALLKLVGVFQKGKDSGAAQS
ncbi:MAG TPA: cache domain-containing protein [Blastocatellia bacterium]|nr:cache domain-containing protein [Blastocatellia bacterium]